MKKLTCILVAVLLIISLGGCSQAEDDSIVGKWKYIGDAPVADDGTTVDYWEFYEDGTQKVVFTDGSDSGVEYWYELSGNELNIYREEGEGVPLTLIKNEREIYNGEIKIMEKQ